MTAFVKTLFSTTGLLIVIYIVIGVFTNTAAPHLPTSAGNISLFHSWVLAFSQMRLPKPISPGVAPTLVSVKSADPPEI